MFGRLVVPTSFSHSLLSASRKYLVASEPVQSADEPVQSADAVISDLLAFHPNRHREECFTDC